MQIRPLSDVLGAEIIGIDLRKNLAASEQAEIKQSLLDFHVLVIRDQTLNPQEQVAFSRIFGSLEIPANVGHTTEESEHVMILSNEIRPDGSAVGVVDGGDFWHSDSSHIRIPSKITILQSVKNPDRGGDTEFCNMHAVYNSLPDGLKGKIDGKLGIHHVSKVRNKRVTISPDRPGARDFYEKQARERPAVLQPLVLEHPETKEKALYCSPRFTVGISGMQEEEADPILDSLFGFITDKKRRHHYRHKYEQNDMVIWDNRSLCHRAVGGYGLSDIRRMHRTVVGGDTPYIE